MALTEHRREYQRQYRILNREKVLTNARRYYQENKERLSVYDKEYGKAYYQAHKTYINEKNRLSYQKNKVRYGAISKKWRINNRHRDLANHVLADKRRKGFTVEITKDELIMKYIQTPECPWCGIEFNWNGTRDEQSCRPTLDRINNENVIRADNTQLLCSKCNVTKQNRTMKELLECLTKGIAFCKKYLEMPTSKETSLAYATYLG